MNTLKSVRKINEILQLINIVTIATQGGVTYEITNVESVVFQLCDGILNFKPHVPTLSSFGRASYKKKYCKCSYVLPMFLPQGLREI
jgi:hypothetical protein